MSIGDARKIPFSALLEWRQLEAIDQLAKQNDEPRSEILRRAVDRYLAEEQSA
jgi:hypothetical protein